MDICVLWNMWRLGGNRRHGSADWRGLGSAVLRGIRGSPPTTSVYLQDATTRVLASFRERAIARLLDIAIVFVPVAAPVVLSTLLGGWAAWVGLFALVWMLVYEVQCTSRSGQTWGKRLVGIAVVQLKDGLPLSWRRAAARWAVLLLPNLLPVVGQMLVWSVTSASTWDPRDQGWHDRLARSVVVRTTPCQPGQRPAVGARVSSSAEFWRDLSSHPMIRLFGNGIWMVGLIAWLTARVVNRDTFGEVLGLALTPLYCTA